MRVSTVDIHLHRRGTEGEPDHAVGIDQWVLAGVGRVSRLATTWPVTARHPARLLLAAGVPGGVREIAEHAVAAARADEPSADARSALLAAQARAEAVAERYGSLAPGVAALSIRTTGELAFGSLGLPIYIGDSGVGLRLDPAPRALPAGTPAGDPAVLNRGLRRDQIVLVSTVDLDPVLEAVGWMLDPDHDLPDWLRLIADAAAETVTAVTLMAVSPTSRR